MLQRQPFILNFLILIITSLTPTLLAKVSSSDAGKDWESRKTTIIKPADSPDELSKYGGWKKHQITKTGFFHTIRKGKKWWLVDPDGYLYISIGINSVEPQRVQANNPRTWAKETHKLITENGFNSIGRWSAPEQFQSINKEIPWCSTLGFMKHYLKQKTNADNSEDLSENLNQTIPVFDKEWPAFCERYAKQETNKTINNPFLIGHFSDNELDFRPDALSRYLSLPKNDEGHQAALTWMEENKIRKSKIDDPKVQAAFLELVSKKYFETVAKALKKADPNHLYIGSRLHGRCINEPVIRGASICDIVSINYYHSWEPDKTQTAEWTKWSEKPFLVGEFYAMKVTSKRLKVDGAGFRVLKHQDAGEFYHTYTSTLLKKHPNCVGWHWFKYADAFDDHQKGIVSTKAKIHQPLTDAMRILNTQAYSLREAR